VDSIAIAGVAPEVSPTTFAVAETSSEAIAKKTIIGLKYVLKVMLCF
jgi:hypothetical protein